MTVMIFDKTLYSMIGYMTVDSFRQLTVYDVTTTKLQ